MSCRWDQCYFDLTFITATRHLPHTHQRTRRNRRRCFRQQCRANPPSKGIPRDKRQYTRRNLYIYSDQPQRPWVLLLEILIEIAPSTRQDGNILENINIQICHTVSTRGTRQTKELHLDSLESDAATTDGGPNPLSIKSSLKTVAEAMPSKNAAMINTNCCAVKPERTKSECSFFSGITRTHKIGVKIMVVANIIITNTTHFSEINHNMQTMELKTYPISKNPFYHFFHLPPLQNHCFFEKILKFSSGILFIIEKKIRKSETERIK